MCYRVTGVSGVLQGDRCVWCVTGRQVCLVCYRVTGVLQGDGCVWCVAG